MPIPILPLATLPSDRFRVRGFHSVEFWCGDALNAARRFQHGLGFDQVAVSDLTTGNPLYASYVLQSGDLVLAFTAPYGPPALPSDGSSPAAAAAVPRGGGCGGPPHPGFDREKCVSFTAAHGGLAVRAVGVKVDDVGAAYSAGDRGQG